MVSRGEGIPYQPGVEATCAVGTHPTGMLSCYCKKLDNGSFKSGFINLLYPVRKILGKNSDVQMLIRNLE